MQKQFFFFPDKISLIDWDLIGMDMEIVDIAINWTRDVHMKFVGKEYIYLLDDQKKHIASRLVMSQ